MDRASKEKRMRKNVDMAAERQLRMIERSERRERRPGERDELKRDWEKTAEKIDRDGKLAEIWNSKEDESGGDSRPMFGYFSGVTIKNGKIVR